MDLSGRAVALYGRFTPGVRDRLQRDIELGGGYVARDLTRRSDALVIGALATGLIESGALSSRLEAARVRGVPVQGERAFADALAGKAAHPTLPLRTALAQARLDQPDADLLAAFDLIVVANDNCRFGDASVMRTAGELLGWGRPWADVVRILTRARDLAPKGRHKIVLTPSGEAALQWSEGLTTLEGQGFLPLDDDDHASVDDLFQRAAIAEAVGDAPEAERLYDLCARADRADAIAPYNWGNLRLAAGSPEEAALAYRRALERDPKFVEARYNLAQALEALQRMDEAAGELEKALTADPAYADAVFNLAQLRLKGGDLAAARGLFERYLTLGPPPQWAAIARRGALYCTAGLLEGG